jgi:signal transduction histidine kinase
VGSRLKEKNNSIQRQKAWLWATLVGLVGVIVGIILMYRNYGQKKKLHQQSLISLKAEEKLNNFLAVEKERTRIATDMHDDLGAGLSTLRFLSEKVKRNSFSDITKSDIEKMQNTSGELMEKMNEIIWAMNEKNDTLEDLLFYSRNYVVRYCEENNISCAVSLPGSIQNMAVSSELRRNVYLIFKESLHNIVRHSGARKVTISVQTENKLEVRISDDGNGIQEAKNVIFGNGLLNMQKRVKSLNGDFSYFSNNGFTVRFSVPLA